VKSQLEIVQLQIGMCPQFDVLWDELTVEEHLLFYARVKGVAPKDEAFQVTKCLTEVQL
jgi:ABC-type multidrug transport system ATPase subunit